MTDPNVPDDLQPQGPQTPADVPPQATPPAGAEAGADPTRGGGGEMHGALEAEQTAIPPDFGELDDGMQAPGDAAALSMLYDLTLPVTIELGRSRMSVQELLALGRGSVVQLDRLAGEPIDVFVGDRLFAEGEVVVVGEQFAVRISRILGAPTHQGAVPAEA